jgi:hypothetical protein
MDIESDAGVRPGIRHIGMAIVHYKNFIKRVAYRLGGRRKKYIYLPESKFKSLTI